MRHVFSIIWLSEHIRALYCWCLFCFLWSWVCHGKSLPVCFTFTSPVELFGVVHQTTVHIWPFFFLSFFSLLLFSLFFLELAYGKYWERLGFGNTYLEAFVSMFILLIHIMWVLCFLLHTVDLHPIFLLRIYDLLYYTPALQSIVRCIHNCNVDPSSTLLTPSDPETWSSWHRHRGPSYILRKMYKYITFQMIFVIFMIFMILLVQN